MIKRTSVGLFKGLGVAEIDAIRAAATKRTCGASNIIVRAEDPAMHLFVIEAGSVDYYVLTNDGRQILLRRLVPGNAFGYATFLAEPIGYLGTAEAVHRSEMLVWEHRVVRQFAATYPLMVENALHASLHYVAM